MGARWNIRLNRRHGTITEGMTHLTPLDQYKGAVFARYGRMPIAQIAEEIGLRNTQVRDIIYRKLRLKGCDRKGREKYKTAIKKLWARKRSVLIAQQLGISQNYVWELAKELGLPPRQFYKSYSCKACGRKHNPRLERPDMLRSGSNPNTVSFCRLCRDKKDDELERRRKEAYDLRVQGLSWTDVEHKTRFKGSGGSKACRAARIHAEKNSLPWPIQGHDIHN